MSTNPFAEQEWPSEPCAGDTHSDSEGRLWTFCPIEHGLKGGRWAYSTVIGRPWKGVVVDVLQHLQAAHFAGMLSIPWDGHAKLCWVLGREHCHPVPQKRVPAPPETTRFERLEKPPSEEEPE